MARSRRSDSVLSQSAKQTVCSYLSMARAIAEPIAAAGDPAGSYEVWSCTLRLLTDTTEGGGDMKTEFRRVLRSCESESLAPEAKLAAVRDAARPYVGDDSDARYSPAHRSALSDIRWYLDVAIQIGAPSYNSGDHRGCYEVYAATARFVSKTVAGATGAKERLNGALQECLEMDDPDNQAWAMRYGFDDVLSGSFGPPITDASELVREYISSAIQIGAPAYDAGDHRGCYDVYACTARLILNTVRGCKNSKRALQEALDECGAQSSASEQAWTMRYAFDRILAGANGR